jgi:hypothetical protein
MDRGDSQRQERREKVRGEMPIVRSHGARLYGWKKLCLSILVSVELTHPNST